MTQLESIQSHLMGNYGQRDLMIVKGKGSRAYDSGGNEYLDFLGGIAVNNVGHNHPEVVEAIIEQAQNLLHCSNVFLIESQAELANRLASATGLDKVFFGNSGTEVTEGGMKLARRWANDTKGPGHDTIICFEGAFHGRSYGAMSATWNPKVREGFGPILPNIKFAKLNDLNSVKDVWDDTVCAVMIETVQGEGGVRPCSAKFLKELRQLTEEKNALLIMDEIQCGVGRTGYRFSYQHGEIKPDIVLAAKAIGGGLPLGAIIARENVAEALVPGTHGSTFGGNPVSCAAGIAVCNIVFENDFIESVRKKGHYLWSAFSDLKNDFPELIDHVRGPGLMLGIQLTESGVSIPGIGRKHGLLFNCTSDSVLRFLPPLTTRNSELDEAVEILKRTLTEFQETKTKA